MQCWLQRQLSRLQTHQHDEGRASQFIHSSICSTMASNDNVKLFFLYSRQDGPAERGERCETYSILTCLYSIYIRILTQESIVFYILLQRLVEIIPLTLAIPFHKDWCKCHCVYYVHIYCETT